MRFAGTLILAGAALAAPQEPRVAVVELGRELFLAPALSVDGKVSCATCHDPARAFADGKADATGVMGVPVGRNSPTLYGLGTVRRFRDPDQAAHAGPGRAPKTLTLEQRVMGPISNELEMGASEEDAIRRLAAEPGRAAAFDRAFGGSGGVSKERVARALAAFVASAAPPETPYGAFLEGRREALRPEERRGLEVFRGAGRCDRCHSGPGLTDGLMHVADPPDGPRMRGRATAAARRRLDLLRRRLEATAPEELLRLSAADLAREAEEKARKLPGGGGYDAEQLEVQTPTLWSATETAPWFRDGSADDLKLALAAHVRELRLVNEREADVAATLSALDAKGKRAPPALRPKGARATRTPEALSPQALDDLFAFLGSLSPR